MAGYVSASRKLRILVVEDLKQWREPIVRLFAGHLVVSAATFEEAENHVEPGGILYDVAIVDLNLITPEDDVEDNVGGDMLGGEILMRLRQNYPSTLRIALTGSPPKGPLIKNLVERYQVYDFFMKDNMDLSDLRDRVLESPAAQAAVLDAAPATPEVEQVKAGQLDRLREWAQPRRMRMRQSIGGLQGRVQFADRADAGDPAKEALKARLEDLETERDDLDRECAKVETMLAQARTMAEVTQVVAEIDRLIEEP